MWLKRDSTQANASRRKSTTFLSLSQSFHSSQSPSLSKHFMPLAPASRIRKLIPSRRHFRNNIKLHCLVNYRYNIKSLVEQIRRRMWCQEKQAVGCVFLAEVVCLTRCAKHS
ncbi:hypothetical protein J3459_007565 [Metarhizium acridum]|nr:hypothetical protein J3459_018686 [Metarhizium acridum]KAG8427047.1 hypothetical protein J3459_007565 [Metarhizium acridum]